MTRSRPQTPRREHDECSARPDGGYTCWPSSALEASGSPVTGSVDRDLEVFRIASEHFRHDLTAFWSHSTFFLLIQGALVTVFSGAVGPMGIDEVEGLVSVRVQAVLLALVGLFIALFWAWVAHRRRVLISLWRQQVLHLDGVVDRHGVYLHIEPEVARHWWFGPTAFTAKLPIAFVAVWTAAVGWLVYGAAAA